jgi:hypothetical protein
MTAYLHCGRCGLQIRIQAEFLRLENCPRCLARTATVSPMALSAKRVTPAAGWGAGAGQLHGVEQPASLRQAG